LDVQRGRVLPKAGNGGDSESGNGEIEAIVEVPEKRHVTITSQFDVERLAASR
jgi:hypothetical protein